MDNLLAGGRCISTCYEAFATTRLTPGCMATGQAAGTAAAIAAAAGRSPQELGVSALQEALVRGGAVLS
ncbi:FAD-dependent oxidoreductase [Paenibacillus humicola]|uniref:FAD-dependent oxidoreductase n=1 Tax=Paenibacillus humicola TaxID=3110540 RepID=UPI00308450A2